MRNIITLIVLPAVLTAIVGGVAFAGDFPPSSAARVELYKRAIAGRDARGPSLHAVIELNSHAMDEARALDAERTAGHARGPLHGRAHGRTCPGAVAWAGCPGEGQH